MVNFGPLAAEICWRVWGTPANFNGCRVLASLLHRRRSTEVNQTLQDVWPSAGLVRYTLRGPLSANGILPGVKFTLRPWCVNFCRLFASRREFFVRFNRIVLSSRDRRSVDKRHSGLYMFPTLAFIAK